ncbi:MOB kinase activator 1A [Platysternon megacephalum]|uniref:MOB kinase activator 1A n=1 Tax=Platysternon megacephalum TaxID=55544 RepID=A0A4D9DWE3_9SAUR|nr:MOB kinase activator 1A [Platysternon megacephalum]
MSFDIQNKLEIIQRWRREDELWDSSHGFFFFFFFFVQEKKREGEGEREREGEREMKKMAKAPLSCKFKCGRDVPANLNVRSLDGQRHTKHGQGKLERGGGGKRKATPMDTHQGLDMKKRPGQANGQ